MPAPSKYTRGFSFRNYQQNNPALPLPGDKVDVELNAIKNASDQTIDRLNLIQRGDGRLANNSVGFAQLEGSLSLGIGWPTPWATATAYEVNETVFESSKLYVCLVEHTSTIFATDLALQRWEMVVDLTQLALEAAGYADAAEGYRDQALAAVSSAQGYANAASASATDAENAAALAAAQALEELSTGVSDWYGTTTGTNAYSVAANDFTPDDRADGQMFRVRIGNGNSGNVTMTVGSYTGASVVRPDGSEIPAGHWPSGSVQAFVWSTSAGKYLWLEGSPASLQPTLAGANAFTGASTHAGAETFNAPVLKTPVALTSGTTVAVDMSDGDNFTLTLGHNATLGAPSNATGGQQGEIVVTQDGTGGRTFGFNAVWKPIGGESILIDAAIGARTVFGYWVVDSSNVLVWRKWSSGRRAIGFYVEYDMGTYATSTTFTQAHGLGRLPSHFEVWLQAVGSIHGFVVGDRVQLSSLTDDNDSSRAATAFMTATNVGIHTGSTEPRLIDNTFADVNIGAAAWKVIFRVYD